MFALADCNNFYASCERLFKPTLIGLPIVVLSNNDGCVIARSNEAKELGIAMGAPYFQIREKLEQNNVAVFSSHYTLYGDLSARVMTNLARFSPDIEVYSIDECFFSLSGFSDLKAYSDKIRSTVIQNTGIPISIGVAPTKVLAKVANKKAKKADGVMVLEGPAEISDALANFPIEDIWGIGRAHATRLLKLGIETADQFRKLPEEWVRREMTVVGARIWNELWGMSCIPLKMVLDPKKNMCTSRAFGKPIEEISELEQAAASYASRLAGKLRREKLCTNVLSVKLLTNRFGDSAAQYFPSLSIPLDYPTSNSVDLVKMAIRGVRRIYRRGYRYQKVEIMATQLIPESEIQMNVFTGHSTKKDKISKALDELNKYYGAGTVRIASEGIKQKWSLRRDFLSPHYTTDWNDIIKVG
ncbi:Y-family DNA polymerase [Pedobacter paludis]|uniref:SOS mutagenesis and repair protein UmuC n=1 Tax=Pedobacter paludis TaxID=2203212 RepID=A0A317F2F6_9SPHI|nr:Y-family DNA polymerase [Pedobacter paludis]PWS32227.1 SOS mutagenesis and repair protein UmuC [Pedobacter paludis]